MFWVLQSGLISFFALFCAENSDLEGGGIS
jgi:hypothetical protein